MIEKLYVTNARHLKSKENKDLYLIDFLAKSNNNQTLFSQFTSNDAFDKISKILETSNFIDIPIKYLITEISNNKLVTRVNLNEFTNFSNK